MTVTDHQLSAWLSGSLTAEEAAGIRAAMDADPALAARAARLRQLDDLVRQAVPLSPAADDALLARLGLATAPAPDPAQVIDLAEARTRRAPAPVRPATSPRWRIAAQVALVAGIGLAVAQLLPERSPSLAEGAYRTLADADGARPNADGLVLFAPGTPPQQARAAVLAAGGTILGTPTETGALRVKATGPDRDDMLARLRARPEVIMAEPIGTRQP